MGIQEKEGCCCPIFSVRDHRLVCARFCGQLAVLLFLSDRATTGTSYCPFCSHFFAAMSNPFSSTLPSWSLWMQGILCVPLYPATVRRDSVMSQTDQLKRDPVQNKTRKRTPACAGVQIASQARSLLCYRCSVRRRHFSLWLL